MSKLVQLKDSDGKVFPKIGCINITNKFSKVGNSVITDLVAYYYPENKKVELIFWVGNFSSTNDWKTILTINDSKYYPRTTIYYPAYSTNAEFGAVGITKNSGNIIGFKKTMFGGTFIYYTN